MPEVRGASEPLVSISEGLRRRAAAPRQCAECLLPRVQPTPRDRARALEPKVQIGSQRDLGLLAQPGLGLS